MVDVKYDLEIPVFSQRRVILIPQAVIESQIWLDSPLVLSKANVILRLGKSLTGCPAVEGAWRADVTVELNRSCGIREKTCEIGIGVGGPTKPISV